jgi:hypothetical protein
MSDKTLLQATMLNLEAERLAYSERAYAEYLHASARDASEPVDHDQSAQKFSDADMAEAFESALHSHAEALAKLRKIDFGAKSVAEAGAVVRFGGRWFVVAVATAPFTCDGITYMGISEDAPIFKAMGGKRVGETFQFNGRELELEDLA